ncbi:hypothetical protein BTO05_07790 [Winogradskyella sp. PC-19]|uniref:T9SS type A sorting domain-containing protein n=1 Tax=unclassified Winogradskyella TaxID=2615021 RepID=UPI000B3C399A|nr:MULTISPECIES: T9SS type A sorting domain-containing protein [unclassified Winogradskyella]ARV09546.1 hypothetical protein BTO05_07790 [Winogradskyella sp. PC-19]RZN83740.1 MAG: T9SS type A sorting domain-containing protein [Winogradskyella sp.]
MIKKILKLFILLLIFSSFSYGQILTFDFQGNVGDEVTANSDFNDIALGLSTISRGIGLTAAANNNSFNSINWSTIDIADAIANDDYVEFTIPAPTGGFSYNVTTINFDLQRSNNGLTAIALRSSLDAYATNIDAEITLADVNSVQDITFNVNQLQNTDAITYRLYGYSENTNGNGRFDGPSNNIEINGSINTFPAPTCNVSDDFSSGTLGAEWTDVGGNSSIINSRLSIATGGATALDYVHQDVSGSYNTTLNTLTNSINWEFNMRQSRGNPSGFNSSNYGVAFVLGASDSDLTQGDGYAVVLGQSGATDNVRLVSYSNGLDLNGNLTDIITGAVDFGNNYLSIKVTYDPATDTWELFVRDDSGNFSSPSSLDNTNSIGNIVNTTHTGTALNHIAAVWNHATQANATAIFDNICISVDKCSSSTTWDGTNWSAGIPNSSTEAILNGDYTTSATTPSFTACSLVINDGFTLIVSNGDFIEIENDVAVNNNASITTETEGSFVQNGDGATAGVFALASLGSSNVSKTTSPLAYWYSLTYWSSPVQGESTDGALFDSSRVFWFNANNYLDANGDSLDDDANAWTREQGDFPMTPGQGFAGSHNEPGFIFPGVGYGYIFSGPYNTGDITYPVVNNTANGLHWNLIGNPYPSAIDVDAFFTENGTVAPGNNTVYEVLYMWSQVNPVDAGNAGNEVLNYNQNDYITINAISESGNGTTAAPSRQIPSGQAFFIPSASSGDVVFTNSMRVSGNGVNTEFYRTSNAQNTNNAIEKLNINLSSDVGIYSQISVAYADFATDDYDGNAIDTFRNYAGNAGVLYSLDTEGNGFYVIQGKAKSSLTEDEVIKIGFGAYISTNETYTLEIVKKEGDFLSTNPIYLKDNDLNMVHNLGESSYTFNSDGGSFDERFEIIFNNAALSIDDEIIAKNRLSIVEFDKDNVEFSVKNNIHTIESILIYDLQGRLVYNLEGNTSTEVFNLSNLTTQVYIAKVTLSNGQVISKKAIKK